MAITLCLPLSPPNFVIEMLRSMSKYACSFTELPSSLKAVKTEWFPKARFGIFSDLEHFKLGTGRFRLIPKFSKQVWSYLAFNVIIHIAKKYRAHSIWPVPNEQSNGDVILCIFCFWDCDWSKWLRSHSDERSVCWWILVTIWLLIKMLVPRTQCLS